MLPYIPTVLPTVGPMDYATVLPTVGPMDHEDGGRRGWGVNFLQEEEKVLPSPWTPPLCPYGIAYRRA